VRVKVSVVIPCLNEADTLAACIAGAREGLDTCDPEGEVIVADNGSSDGSREIALAGGARLVDVAERGYGSALLAGIREARGRWIIMGDADDSYDFREIPRFVEALAAGPELVQGCRLPSGGGTILPGAMPFLHRWVGNPVLSGLVRWWFGARIRDVHCGLRGFRKELVGRLDLQCTGMEFASEMIVKAAMARVPMAEVPITLRPDGRVSSRRHLRTFRDGWRHLRFLLLYSPRWLFQVPGMLLVLAGLAGYALALPRASIAGVRFDVHTMLVASLAIVCGFQAIAFSVLARTFASIEGLLPDSKASVEHAQLERSMLVSCIAIVVGIMLIAVAVNQWRLAGFGDLDYSRTMRWVIPGVMLTTLGVQLTLASFFLSLITLGRR
jgi:glycosyltransferase involved in cell wall biosynthesis